MPFNPDILFLKNSSCCFLYPNMYECVQHALDGVNEHGDEALEFIAKGLLFDDLRKNGDEVTSPISKSIFKHMAKDEGHSGGSYSTVIVILKELVCNYDKFRAEIESIKKNSGIKDKIIIDL